MKVDHQLNGDSVVDLLGVGFGPSGIALAVAIRDAVEERPEAMPLKALFLDSSPVSRWQGDMLLPNTDIQHHYLRDFATPRNPRSRYTFPNYLKESGRLFAFGLLDGNPGRIEWADYCSWVCRQVDENTLYLHRATGIKPVFDSDGHADVLKVTAHDTGADRTVDLLARNVVLCIGRQPQVPELFALHQGKNVFHSHDFLSRFTDIPDDRPTTVAVVGSGESAIEIVLYLLANLPKAEIISLHRNSGFRLHDAGNFSNEIYFPEEVDYFYSLPKRARLALIDEARPTNYSAVDDDVGNALYRQIYEDRILNRCRVQMIKRSQVTDVRERSGRLRLEIKDVYLRSTDTVLADFVILCTGYIDQPIPPLLGDMEPYLMLDGDGHPSITRNYEVLAAEKVRAGLFINGFTEITHGISDAASFSMVAVKAARTLRQLERRHRTHEQAQAVSAMAGRT